MKRYSDLKKLLEALSPSQKELVDKYASKAGDAASKISAHVMHSDTIRIPLHDEDDEHQEPHPEVAQHLENHGYKIPDFAHYKSGHSVDPKGRIASIGKALHKTGASEELKRKFVNDPTRATKKNSDLEVAISYHPHHVAGMSTDRGWSSCMDMAGGCNNHYLEHDIKHGTHVAYLVRKDDKDIDDPIARINLKPFVHKKTEEGFYKAETHARHREEHVKDLYNEQIAKEGKKFVDFAVSPDENSHYAIAKNEKTGKHELLAFNQNDMFDGVGEFDSKEDVFKHINNVFAHSKVKKDAGSHTVLRPEESVYGTASNQFQKTVKNWAEKNFPTIPDVTYKKPSQVYDDDNQRVLRNYSDEKLKSIGEAISKHYAGDKSPEVQEERKKIYDEQYHPKEIEKIYDAAVFHSKANNSSDDHKNFILGFGHRMALGDYTKYQAPNKELANKQIQNLKSIGDLWGAKHLIEHADKENYEMVMDDLHQKGRHGEIADIAAKSPHIRDKEIDLIVDKFPVSSQDIPHHKLKPHHIEQLISKNSVYPNVVASPHYNSDSHEKHVDNTLKKFENTINQIGSLQDESAKKILRDEFRSDFRNKIMNMARGALPEETYETSAKDHMSTKIADKLIDFSKKHDDFFEMDPSNYKRIRFSNAKNYDDSHVENELDPSEESVTRKFLNTSPKVEHVDKLMDRGYKFDPDYSIDDSSWNAVFKSEKAKKAYAQSKMNEQSSSSQRAFYKSLKDSDFHMIENHAPMAVLSHPTIANKSDFSQIDYHIKKGNKKIASHLHKYANDFFPEYKLGRGLKFEQRIQGMKDE